MPLEMPVIDDRTYDDLLEEIRARVPRYTPEWTDLNDNEPGMVLAQLFAWLADMLLYRLGKVPQLNRVKFLELLGFQLRSAEPAIAQITFPVKDKAADSVVIVPQRTQIAAEGSDDDGQIIFETQSSLYAIRAQLKSLMTEHGTSRTIVTTVNNAADSSFTPFGNAASVDSALLLGFSEALPKVDLELAVWVDSTFRAGGYNQCGETSRISFSQAPILWEFWNGSGWSSLALIRDTTEYFTRSGYVRLKPPGSTMSALTLSPETQAYYWLRARLARSIYDSAPRLIAIRTNTIDAAQAETIADEILGGSDASPNQTFALSRAPVLANSLQLDIDEGQAPQVWREISDLYGCSRRDPCFTIDRATGEVRFGDGVTFGAIPLANPSKPNTNIVAREYRVGGGTRGNVAAGKLNVLVTSVSSIDSGKVTNLFAAGGGADTETMPKLERRAAQSLRERDRAVTAEDFESLAKQAANIGRAQALPLFHPSFPDIEVPGVITMIVIPNRDIESDDPAQLDRKPTPGELTLKTVCSFLDARRLLTSELYIIGPTYRRVEIEGLIIATDDADLATVYDAVIDDLLTYLDPLTGGRQGTGWPFGGTIYYSLILQRITAVSGVERVSELTIRLENKIYSPCTDVAIGKHEIIYSDSHDNLRVEYEEET